MRKKIIIILIILSIFLTGCTNKEEIKNKIAEQVNTTIKDLTNINISSIQDSYNYLKDNYQNYKNDEVYENLLYHINYLEILGKYSSNNELTELAQSLSDYLENPTNSNKEKVSSSLDELEKNSETTINELYNNYLKQKTILKTVETQTSIVKSDIEDSSVLTKETINKAINYLSAHIQEPLKNDEILTKTTYYSLFLSMLDNESNISLLGTHMFNYLNTLDEKEKDLAIKYLNIVLKNQDSEVNTLYDKIKSN